MPVYRQSFLPMLALGLFIFTVYVQWIAEPATLLWISHYQLDKLAHLGGGLFLALAVERWRREWGFRRFAGFLFLVTIGWETFEFLFDGETRYFFKLFPGIWIRDTVGDVAVALAGGFAWRAAQNEHTRRIENDRGEAGDDVR